MKLINNKLESDQWVKDGMKEGKIVTEWLFFSLTFTKWMLIFIQINEDFKQKKISIFGKLIVEKKRVWMIFFFILFFQVLRWE